MIHSEASSLALNLMGKFGLIGDDSSNWNFKFDRAVRRFGYCQYKTKTISLSYDLVGNNSLEHVQDVILHEISHALVGPGHGHGDIWKQSARRVGARPERCYSSVVKATRRTWIGYCPNCNKVFYRFRRKTIACGTCCGGIFSKKYLIAWKPNESV